MAIIKIVAAGKTKASLKTALEYIQNPSKITLQNSQEQLSTPLNCWGTLKNIYETMISTKEMFRKDIDNKNSEMYKHFQQSFKPHELNPQTAHQIGIEWAQSNFANQGFELLVCTHLDKEHIHNHIIINSVNAITGKTIQIKANKTLEALKASSDELCQKYGLSIIERRQINLQNSTNTKLKYKQPKRYSILNEAFAKSSWQKYFYDAVCTAMQQAKNKGFACFAEELAKKEITIDYKRLKDDIIFSHKITGKRISNVNLETTFAKYHESGYLLRDNIAKIVGAIPAYDLTAEKILSEKKQGFYRLIENLIKVIDTAKTAATKQKFYEHLAKYGWQIKHTPTGRAYFHQSSDRLFYDSTIYKIVKDENYCLARIEANYDKIDA